MPHIGRFESDILAINLEIIWFPTSNASYTVTFLKRVSENGKQESWTPYNDFKEHYPLDKQNIRVGTRYCGSDETYTLDLYVPFATKGRRTISCNLSDKYIQLNERCIPIIERKIGKFNDSYPTYFVERICKIKFDRSCNFIEKTGNA